jgi:tRNA dimethylallyltransferase
LSAGSDGADVVGVICGPTAAGKSALAMRLAERHGRAIIAADSRQVYRRFDIGTAKPTPDERRRVAHTGLDLAEPTERFSAAQWAAHASETLAHARRDALPIVTGGTGLYLRALFEGLFDEPTMDGPRRRALLEWLDGQTTARLRAWVTELDPARAALGRTQLLRAIEVALLTGERISGLHRLHASREGRPRWRARYLVVDPGAALHQRIASRLDSMIASGWLDEARALDGVPDDAPAWKATGYRTLRNVVQGTMNLHDARERILIDTRQYAKRQRTWFRHQLPEASTIRVNPEAADAERIVADWWASVQAS